MFKKIFFLLFIQLVFISLLVESNTKHWLYSCQFAACLLSIDYCLNCFGEKNCTKCLETMNSLCSTCAENIFNQDHLEINDGAEYFICDPLDYFQNKVCHFYCRGKYFPKGNCVRLNNIPMCHCSLNSTTQ